MSRKIANRLLTIQPINGDYAAALQEVIGLAPELAVGYLKLESRLAAMQKVVDAATEYWAFCKATGWETSDDNHYLPKALAELDGEAK